MPKTFSDYVSSINNNEIYLKGNISNLQGKIFRSNNDGLYKIFDVYPTIGKMLSYLLKNNERYIPIIMNTLPHLRDYEVEDVFNKTYNLNI